MMRFSSWKIDIEFGTATRYDGFDVPDGCFKVRPTSLENESPELSSYVVLCYRGGKEITARYREKGKFNATANYLLSSNNPPTSQNPRLI
jgi:hypothetical protein